MGLLDAVGYMASGLVFLAFCMKAIVPLRIVAVGSNVAFIAYGFGLDLVPVLALHCALLPMNCWRLWQAAWPIRYPVAGPGEVPIRRLRPFMAEHSAPRGTVLLQEGAPAGQLYCIVSGHVLLPESGVRLSCGALIGGHSLVSVSIRQRETVVCETDVRLLRASEEALAQLCDQNPRLALQLAQGVMRRWMDDLTASFPPSARGTGRVHPKKGRTRTHRSRAAQRALPARSRLLH